jgi:hypothetical protein
MYALATRLRRRSHVLRRTRGHLVEERDKFRMEALAHIVRESTATSKWDVENGDVGHVGVSTEEDLESGCEDAWQLLRFSAPAKARTCGTERNRESRQLTRCGSASSWRALCRAEISICRVRQFWFTLPVSHA